MKAKVIGKVSLETIRRIKKDQNKRVAKVHRLSGFSYPFKCLGTLVQEKRNGKGKRELR